MNPLNEYDHLFGGARGAAEKARAKMHRTYGKDDGEHVFRASIAKRKRKGKKTRSLAQKLLGGDR